MAGQVFSLAGGPGERSGDSTAQIPRARWGERELVAADIDEHKDSWPKKLTCGGCSMPVLAVRGYDKEGSRWSACFRRWPGHSHEQGCQYDLHAQVKQIAEDSDGLLSGGRAGWRLVSEQVLHQPKPRPGEPRQPRPDLTFTRKATQLLNTAAKVSALIERFRVDGIDIAGEFKASCDGKLVSWQEFHYLPREVWRLVRRLHPGGGELPGEVSVPHPVAIALHVRTARPRGRGDSLSFALEQPAPGSWLTPDDPGCNVALRSKTAGLLQPYRPGTWVLALGQWKLWSRDVARPPLELCLWVDSPHQLVQIPPPPASTVTRYQP